MKYTQEDVKDLTGLKNTVISKIRPMLDTKDWKHKKFEGVRTYCYTEKGLKEIERLAKERDLRIINFLEQVKATTNIDEIDNAKRNTEIKLAVLEYLAGKGYTAFEISKYFGESVNAIWNRLSKGDDSWTYKVIKEEITNIGDRIWLETSTV